MRSRRATIRRRPPASALHGSAGRRRHHRGEGPGGGDDVEVGARPASPLPGEESRVTYNWSSDA